MPAGEAVMSPEELRAWMGTNLYVPETLGPSLTVHPVTIRKWMNGTHPVDRQVHLALRHLERDTRERARRRRSPGDLLQHIPAAVPVPFEPAAFVAWMTERGYTVDWLADELGVHRQSVLKWRKGRHPMTLVTYLALQEIERRGARAPRRQGYDPPRAVAAAH